MSGGAKALRKAAVKLSAATSTSVEFYLKLPIREFFELNEEVAEVWQSLKR